jgi:hypothetical protein
MKTKILLYLRLGGSALVLATVLCLVVSGIGWLAGWRTAIQFSDALSNVGSIVVVLGLLSLASGLRMRGGARVPNRRTDGDINRSAGAGMWTAEAIRGYNPLILLAMTGIVLIGVSLLIGN